MKDDNIQNEVELLKSDLIQHLGDRLSDFRARLSSASLSATSSASCLQNGEALRPGSAEQRDPVQKVSGGGKRFHARDSMLTELLESSHIRSIYHIFAAVLAVLILSSMFQELMDDGRINFHVDLIAYCFGKMPEVMMFWVMLFFSTLCMYAVFYSWANSLGSTKVEDYVWLLMYVGYVAAVLVYPIVYIARYELPIASSMIVVCEQVRLLMKVHAFVRENVPRVLEYKRSLRIKTDSTNGAEIPDVEIEENPNPFPGFGRFLYFLFAPTLIYRDEYPRREKTDWSYVATNFLQVLACLFYCNFLISHFIVPGFQNFQTRHVTLRTFISGIFSSVLPGTLVLLLAFFAFLHSWLNAFAEMLCFADRMFYKDWWNSTSFSGYYRTWNVVVHDWLYTYVYMDIMKFAKGTDVQRRASSAVSVFLLSALVHEYIIGIALRFIYPVMFVEFFGFGVMMFFLTGQRESRGWNVVMWFGLLVGTGLMMCLYSLEYYARRNCAPTYDNFLDWIIPRSWICVPK